MGDARDTNRMSLTPAESEMETLLGGVALPAPGVDLYRAAFDAGQISARRSMRRRWALVATGLLVALVSVYGAYRGSGGDRDLAQGRPAGIKVREVRGSVLVKHEGRSVWEELAGDGGPLWVGDTLLSAHDGTAVLALADNSRVVLASNSRLKLAHANGGLELGLAQGKVTADLTSPHPPFVVDTPQGRVHALGTTFTVSVGGSRGQR